MTRWPLFPRVLDALDVGAVVAAQRCRAGRGGPVVRAGGVAVCGGRGGGAGRGRRAGAAGRGGGQGWGGLVPGSGAGHAGGGPGPGRAGGRRSGPPRSRTRTWRPRRRRSRPGTSSVGHAGVRGPHGGGGGRDAGGGRGDPVGGAGAAAGDGRGRWTRPSWAGPGCGCGTAWTRTRPNASPRMRTRQQERRDGYLVQESTGMWLLHGVLPAVAGATLKAALDPLAAPRPATDGTPDPQDGRDAVRRRPHRAGRAVPGRPRHRPVRAARRGGAATRLVLTAELATLHAATTTLTDTARPTPARLAAVGWRGWCRRSCRPGSRAAGRSAR